MQTYNTTFDQPHDRPVVLYFTAPWCVPCKKFGPIMDKVAEKTPGIDFIKVDADENFNVASEYNVRSLPTLVYLWDGNVKDRLMGAHSDVAVSLWLERQ